MKAELFGGSQDGRQFNLNRIPSKIEIPVMPELKATVDPDYDPRNMLTTHTLSYTLDKDGRYKAEDMTK